MTSTEIASASKIMLGTTEAVAMYIGSTKIWPTGSAPQPHDYSQDYFTIESLEDSNQIKMQRNKNPNYVTLSYSLDDGETWTTTTIQGTLTFATINTGQKIIFKGNNERLATAWDTYNYFNATKQFKVYGNVMSLLFGDNFVNNSEFFGEGTTHNFAGLFNGTTTLIDASNLLLPALVGAPNCYNGMFRGCTNLQHGPKILPALSISLDSYSSMFEGCINLEEAPEIHAISLSSTGSLQRMFCMNRNSKITTPKLTKGPVIKIKGVNQYSVREMFKGNGNLTEITCLITEGLGNNDNMLSWVSNVSSSGTFYKHPNTNWSTGVYGVPSGWTTQNYSIPPSNYSGLISEYVQNGLIFHLDGIDKGQGSDWTDLIGGIQFSANGGATSTSNSWHFNGANSSYLSSINGAWNSIGGSQDFTVEVCYSRDRSNTNVFLFRFGQDNYSPIYYFNGQYITWLQNENVYNVSFLPNYSKYTVSLNNDQGYVNKTILQKSSTTDYWDKQNQIILGGGVGGSAANNPLYGNLYSIRIYNRKLSRAEQLQNMEVDNQRFNLELL